MLIKGQLPKKRDTVDWSPEKLYQFIRFADFFIEGDSFVFTVEKVKACCERSSEEKFWPEFISRLDSKGKVNKFRLRHMTMTRTILSWVKDNPHAVTPEMERIMEPTKRLNWALNPFKDKETAIGAGIVSLDKVETTNQSIANQNPHQSNPQSPEAQYYNGMKKVASLFKELVEGVDRKELKKMPVDKKLRAIDAFAKTLHRQMQGKGPQNVIFKQLNVNRASKEDLENAFIEYGKSQ